VNNRPPARVVDAGPTRLALVAGKEMKMKTLVGYCSALLGAAGFAAVADSVPAPVGTAPDFTKEKVFYVVPYAHLDTQWRWDYPTTINEYLKSSLEPNFKLFEKYPHYVYNLAGTWRYELIQEYYPDEFKRVQHYVSTGQWHPAGQQAEETDSNVPAPESIIRNVLYGGRFLKKEFGIENHDYLLPDCFGFQAFFPSVLAHCGLVGFGTQKLSWGHPGGPPFRVCRWVGPDGRFVIGALDGTDYTGRIGDNFANEDGWANRLDSNGRLSGLFVDYRYFGVGDRAGACRETDVANLEKSLATPGKFKIVPSASGRMYDDIMASGQAQMLPEYRGDLLLTEHSAGSITSQGYMKRWNRKGEQLAQAAEGAAVAADWLGALAYDSAAFERNWKRLIASQFHDNLPGTSLPVCYDYCYNDDLIALKGFAAQLTDSMAAVAAGLDTSWCRGTPVVVWNPLAVEREDVVEVTVPDGMENPGAFDAQGRALPSQAIEGGKALVLVNAPSVGATVFDLRSGASVPGESALKVAEGALENSRYQVTVNAAGDIAQVFDKKLGRNLLAAAAQVQFLYEKPGAWPAWNMDWADRRKPVEEVLGGPAKIRIVENGPVRVALAVERMARNSKFVQTLRLSAGSAADRFEICTFVDWRGKGCSVKHAFPFTAANEMASYNLGLGTIQRPTDNPDCFEMPAREWRDLTDRNGAFGISVLEDCKYGSDKPDDHTLRLTLLYTPFVRGSYKEQQWQDWGRHEMTYALYGHTGDGRGGAAELQGRRLNQPLRAFLATRHSGVAPSRSLLSLDTDRIDLRALKKAEDGKSVIIRLQEIASAPTQPVSVRFGEGIQDAWEVDGQEKRIADARVVDGKLQAGVFPTYACRAFAIVPKPASAAGKPAVSEPLDLSALFNADVVSADGKRADGDFAGGLSIPAEQLPAGIICGGVRFETGPTSDGHKNAVVCSGQKVALPQGAVAVHFLMAGDEDTTAFGQPVPAWNRPIGNWDQRQFAGNPGRDDGYEYRLCGLKGGFVKPGRIAWSATHHHSPKGNEAYQFSYLFDVVAAVDAGAREIALPVNERVKVLAASAVTSAPQPVTPAAPLHDNPGARGEPAFDSEWAASEIPSCKGCSAIGVVATERKEGFAAVSVPPGRTGRAIRDGVTVRVAGGLQPHGNSGGGDGLLPRLTDGDVAQNDDDTGRCVWFDNGAGRFVMDLGESVPLVGVRTYSWHKSNRAPQVFSLWAAAGETMPAAAFTRGEGSGWTLLGKVDTAPLGEGGCHLSSITGRAGAPLGTYRWLLWTCTEAGEGTFFTELEAEAQKPIEIAAPGGG
jgi:alpha-mannosidase